MPGEDGYSLIRRFRALEPPGRLLPAVAVTAYARSEDRVRALASGFTTHIAKPVEPLELVTVVGVLAGRIRYASDAATGAAGGDAG
jgi:CheY-like chemotaxis protein